MAEFLSQDEIDALLDIAEQGEDIDGEQEEKIVSKEKTIRFMILKNPIEFPMNNLKPSQHCTIKCYEI